jgi:type IV pilus assembly protein PilB
MRNMGIAPFNIASSGDPDHGAAPGAAPVRPVQAAADIPYETLLDAGFKEERRRRQLDALPPGGLLACNNGYKGRVGIYQVMPISEDMQRIILATAARWRSPSRPKAEGVRSLRQSGLHKVRLGLTSLEEVLACTNE